MLQLYCERHNWASYVRDHFPDRLNGGVATQLGKSQGGTETCLSFVPLNTQSQHRLSEWMQIISVVVAVGCDQVWPVQPNLNDVLWGKGHVLDSEQQTSGSHLPPK
jgi:hypothetical protein